MDVDANSAHYIRNKRESVSFKVLLKLCLVLLIFNIIIAKGNASDHLYEAWRQRGSVVGPAFEKDAPVIVWWTDRLFIGHPDIEQLRCDDSVCYSTANRSYGALARAFYFYGTDLDPEDLPLPRLPHHEWALIHEESPMNNYILSHGPMIRQFNYTATFKRESSYPLCTHSLPSLDFLVNRRPVDLRIKNELRHKGFAPVLYVQSHCDVPSDRDRFVKELMQHIAIDSYGKCLHNRDFSHSLNDPVESMLSEEFLAFAAQYKFHLAFENAICSDYVTEKLFRPLHVGSVPIYRGSSRVKDLLPDEHSSIIADDFQSPETLARFISFLDANDDEYAKYLTFKETGVTNKFLLGQMAAREWGINEHGKPNMFQGFQCFVCKQISSSFKSKKANNGVEHALPRHATADQLNCPQPHNSLGNTDDGWEGINWIEDYWTGFDKALAVQEMVNVNETDSKTFVNYWMDIVRR